MAARSPMIHGAIRATVLAAILSVSAFADEESAILWPALGRPALVIPGQTINVGFHGSGAFALVADGTSHTLEAAPGDEERGFQQSALTIPEALPPGAYDLTLTGGGAPALQPGAVHVLPEFPTAYSIALIRAADITRPDSDSAALAESMRALLSPSGAAITFLMGPLAPEGTGTPEEDYATLREALAQLRFPLFLCPSSEDWKNSHYRESFGEFLYTVEFGQDGYLMLGPGFSGPQLPNSEAMGAAYLARRSIRASRWSTGITTDYGLDWAPRSQITLFVDDPLDYLIAGTAPAEGGNTVPWGKTRILPPPALPRATLQILEVSESSIRLRQAVE